MVLLACTLPLRAERLEISIDGIRAMPLPLTQRKAMLADLIAAADDEHLQFSGDFDDPNKLLETCHTMKSRRNRLEAARFRLPFRCHTGLAGGEPGRWDVL